MKHYSLSALQKLPHLSDFMNCSTNDLEIDKLVLNLGLYESVLIDTTGYEVTIAKGTDIYGKRLENSGLIQKIEVSADLKALNRLLVFTPSVMLPCPECEREQVFASKIVPNHFLSKNIPSNFIDTGEQANVETAYAQENVTNYNAFDTKFEYKIGNDNILIHGDVGINKKTESQFSSIPQCCIDTIIQNITEIRKEFFCAFNSYHKLFMYFVIRKASEYCKESVELKQIREKQLSTPSASLTHEEKIISDQYEKMKCCLILEKIGQEPSMADLQLFDVEKYRKIMPKDKFNDLTLALGLYASGVGCGSIVYLRRVFESIVQKAYEENRESKNFNEEEYCKKRFNEKIAYLEDFGIKIIPDELSKVKNKIYGLLSKGVHELSEQEAKELFPFLKYSIELILDNQIEQNERSKKINAMISKLQSY